MTQPLSATMTRKSIVTRYTVPLLFQMSVTFLMREFGVNVAESPGAFGVCTATFALALT